jgi:2'-5' RNA ligase
MGNKLRLFFAYPLTNEEKLYFSQQSSEYFEYFDGKWVDKNNYHITVKFLGEVSDFLVEKIIDNFERNLKFLKPTAMSVDRLGFFGKPVPRVLWFGSSFVRDELIGNFYAIQESLSGFKFRKENYYMPHITICRIKNIKKDFDGTYKIKNLKVTINNIVLYKSTLTKYGSEYEKLKEWEIKR